MAKKPEHRYQAMLHLRDELWQLERRLTAQRAPDSALSALGDPSASVEGAALSTELTLASLRPRRWPLLAAIMAPVAIVSAVLAFELGGHGARAVLERASSEPARSAASAAPPVGLPSPAAPPAPAAEAAPATEAPHPPPATQVLIGVTPPTAHVFLGGQDLGVSPVSVDVAAGERLTVELRHPDYVTKRLELDGSNSKVVEQLDTKSKRGKAHAASKHAPASSPPRATRTPAPRGRGDESIGGQLFVEPWAQKP